MSRFASVVSLLQFKVLSAIWKYLDSKCPNAARANLLRKVKGGEEFSRFFVICSGAIDCKWLLTCWRERKFLL